MDGFSRSLEDLVTAIDKLRGGLDELDDATRDTISRIRTGAPLMDQREHWKEGVRARQRALESLTEVNSMISAARAHFIRVLIDEEGFSIRDITTMLGRPRQLVKRQYDAAHADLQEPPAIESES